MNMNETIENLPLPPAIKFNSDKVRYPYQEQKERWGTTKYDLILVFGQGPIKPVLLPDELTDEQKKQWEDFKKDPLHSKEPDFRVLEGKAYTSILDDIDKRTDLTDEEKQKLIEQKRQEWQKMGRLALNRWGRQNALAAGLCLYLGITDRVILLGGKTRPNWTKQKLSPQTNENWPSEAELMKDIIVRVFGELYQKQYGKPIEEAIIIEDQSTNTLENVANAINKYPNILSMQNIGAIGAAFHMSRIGVLTKIFSLHLDPRGEISAQALLREQAQTRKKSSFEEQLSYMTDHLNNEDYRNRLEAELRWTLGLTDEKYLLYWIGYLADVNNLEVTQKVLKALAQNDNWQQKGREAFQLVGLDFDEFSQLTLEQLNDQQISTRLREGLLQLKKKYRIVPPDLKNI